MERPSPITGDSDIIHSTSSSRDPLTDHLPQPAHAVPSPSLSTSQIDLSFPILDNDGSISDLTDVSSNPSHHYPASQHHPASPTPPAALSSLGARARMDNLSESGASFADSQYDMLDDMSEISTDDHDTASIASYDDQTGQLTPEQTASDFEGEEDKIEDITLSPNVAVKSKSRDTSHHLRQTQAENDLIDSYMSDDLETPRQSTVGHMAPKKAAEHIPFFSDLSTPQAIRDSICAKIASCIEPSKFDNSATSDVVQFPAKNSAKLDGYTLLTRLTCILITLVAFSQFIAPMMADPSQQLVVRREALATVLEQVTASTNATKDYNIEHLLPLPSANCTTNLFTELLPMGPPCKPSSRFQVDSAHSFIISMQPVPSALQTTLTHVSRSDGRELAFNQTKLINGVYHVTFDEDEAHGIITVNMVTRHPRNNFTAVHNFGNPMLHLKTYEKATTDVSKVVTKEVAVIKHAASTFSGKLQSELGATVQTITKELATMRNDLIRMPQDVKAKVKNTTRYLMRCTGARIALARDNLGLIKAGLRRHYGKKTLPAPKPKTSMLTDLSTTVKGAGDQLRRDFDRSKKFLATTEDAASKALRQAKLEVAKAMKQHNKAVESFKQYMKKTKTDGQTHERKDLKKVMKETERALKKAQLEQRRLDARL
ncbi:unnamed protein product [Zymoseptoria tritici ST99CH_1A5]|uniref:Uncharacterized protein n=1 Tax=Zymoseptoria tritici ST99CH_1A5 TaxID=1276529 RepID=A0A1Y6LCG1_ZYMTR|nr:unnamed protein product [Zymoseptoria tritici ST99CH_1A5]